MLVVLWAVKVYTTWAAWGDLTIDSGHEMYVPWILAEGKNALPRRLVLVHPRGPLYQ